MNKHYTHPLHFFIFLITIVAVGSVGVLYIIQYSKDAYAIANFGGKIQTYTPVCILDTPSIAPTTCSQCPACSLMFGSQCQFQSEILFAAAPGSAYDFICPPQSQQYKGGIPRAGSYILGNGIQNFPSQVGVSP